MKDTGNQSVLLVLVNEVYVSAEPSMCLIVINTFQHDSRGRVDTYLRKVFSQVLRVEQGDRGTGVDTHFMDGVLFAMYMRDCKGGNFVVMTMLQRSIIGNRIIAHRARQKIVQFIVPSIVLFE